MDTNVKRLGEGVYGRSDYHHVYADSRARFSNRFGSRRPIRYGDRLFTRIMMSGKVIMEFVVNQVCDLTELLGELRKKTKGLKGLAQVYVRNYSQGWSMEQPLMLYAGSTVRMSGAHSSKSASLSTAVPERPMLFPWETH